MPLLTSDYPRVAALRKLPLELVQEAPDPRVLKAYANNPKAMARYRTDLAAYNEQMQQAGRFWTFSPAVRVLRGQAALDSALQDQQPHLVLQAGKASVGRDAAPALWLKVLQKPATARRAQEQSVLGCFYTTQQMLFVQWHDLFFPSDMVNTVQQMQRYLEANEARPDEKKYLRALEAELTASGPVIQRKTLLIDRNLLAPSVTPEQLARKYPYPVQVVDRSVIEQAVLAADARYLYSHYVMIRGRQVYQLIDMETGRPLAYAKSGSIGVDPPVVEGWVLDGYAKFGAGRK
ncbi:hypothetical protein GCM10028821_30310 [Hymenobacter jeollabukensis]